MIKIEYTEVWGFKHAIRGARNPLESWDKSDSVFYADNFIIGPNDLALMKKLAKAGDPSHRKFLRQIFVSCDWVAPLYWWKEEDQYKIATTTDSCSTMHTLHKRDVTLDDLSIEHLNKDSLVAMKNVLHEINKNRQTYVITKDKDAWWQMIQLLPDTYNQRRTWTGNYETLISMYDQRKSHKLDEWHTICEWIKTLPYMTDLLEAIDEKR